MKFPCGDELKERSLTEGEARKELTKYREIMEGIYCPIIERNCNPNCMFLDDGNVYEDSLGGTIKVFNINPPRCTYGQSFN